jgi:hypothetical protein
MHTQHSHSSRAKFIRRAGTAALLAFLANCSTPDDVADAGENVKLADPVSPPAAAPHTATKTTPAVSLSERSLLEMSFEEAQALSPQHLQVGPLYRVAGDTITILKTDRSGNPVKVLVKGHVFLEMDLGERATGLCDEATVTIRDILMKGNAMVKQGDNVAKSSSDNTSMFIHYDRLNVRGQYEIIKLEGMPLF